MNLTNQQIVTLISAVVPALITVASQWGLKAWELRKQKEKEFPNLNRATEFQKPPDFGKRFRIAAFFSILVSVIMTAIFVIDPLPNAGLNIVAISVQIGTIALNISLLMTMALVNVVVANFSASLEAHSKIHERHLNFTKELTERINANGKKKSRRAKTG